MATIAELNVRLGLLPKDFERSLKGFEQKMQGVAANMGKIGESMTFAISAPLVGFGAIALKVAAEYEALRLAMDTTFESVGRGAVESAAEVEALRKIALAPGLDFEQAVKGSVRLQGVGVSAEKARLILQELGNTIASTGGSADQLDAVTKQFTQIIGKGRILQEDLSIILENMPGLARVLKDEFGTTSAEAIRALGVSAEDFITRLTNRMATMPRAAGGLANAFTNAAVAIRQSFATVGEAINKTFNVTGALNSFSEWITALADKFAALDSGTQATILSVAAFAVALGPAIKAMSLIVSGSTAVVGAFARVAESFRITSAAGTGTLGIFSRMNTAMKLNVFIAAASAVLAIAAAFAVYSASADKATFGSEVFAEAQKSVADETAKETAVLNKNIEVLKNTSASTEERAAAIEELKRAYPDYLRGVDLEKASLVDLTEIQGRLTSEILRGVAERQKASAVNKVYEEQARILLRIQEIKRTGDVTTPEAGLIDTGDMLRAGGIAEAVILKLQEQAKSLGKQAEVVGKDFDEAFAIGTKGANKQYDALTRQRQAVEDAKDALEDMTPAQRTALEFSQKWEATFAKGGSAPRAFSEAKKQADLYKSALASIQAVTAKGDVLGADLFGEQVNEIGNQIERLLEGGFKGYSKEVQNLRGMLATLADGIGVGLIKPNTTQTTLSELDKIESAIGDVNAAFAPIEITPPLVDPTVEEINKVADALANIQSPPPLVFATQTPEVGDVPALPSLEIPRQVVQIDTGVAIAGLKALQEVAFESIEANTSYLDTWTQIQDIMALSTEGLNGFSDAMSAAAAMAESQGDVLGSMALAIGDAVSQAAAQGATSFGELANAAIAAGAKIVRAWIQQGVAAAVAKALSFLPFPFNLAAGAVAGAAAATLFNKAIAAIGVPALAEGGVAHGPTLALIGEYPGAASNPEIVAPESKLRKIFREERSTNNTTTTNDNQYSRIANTFASAMSSFAHTSNTVAHTFGAPPDIPPVQIGEVPGISVPELPTLEVGKVPGVPPIQVGEVPGISVPELPTLEVGQPPKINIPKFAASVQAVFSNLPKMQVFGTHQSDSDFSSESIFERIKIPHLATGAAVKTPTLAMIGEYAQANINPEIVAPESTIRQIFREESSEGAVLTTEIRGDDILFIYDRAAKRRGRIK